MRNPATVIDTLGSNHKTLAGVRVKGTINELFTLVTATQTYRNLESMNIEAVYTFPLPLDATLLDIKATIGERSLTGVVSAKRQAEDRYEEAVSRGDSAILVENPSPGLYSLNLGNLLPGEEASLTFTYASLNRWSDGVLRFFLPTTIAPRYGDPARAGLLEHQIPEHSLARENRMELSLSLVGSLRDSEATSPTHQIETTPAGTVTTVRALGLSSGQVAMDRDFVLLVKAARPLESRAYVEAAERGAVVVASFRPSYPASGTEEPRCLSVVIDCSGSMSGDSIEQARKALEAIISSLRPLDHFNIVRFGSTFRMLFANPAAATPGNRHEAARLARGLDADLGGTEIGNALEATLATSGPEGVPHDILLVTDGQSWKDGALVEKMAASGRRVFTVGVGSAVSEAFLRNLATATAGACELVSPGEGMSQAIIAQFRRISAPYGVDARLAWPSQPLETCP